MDIRRIATWAEYEACVALQREVWGPDFTECVPAAILMVTQRIGGVVAGAFGQDGRLGGFVFGMTGVEHGRLVHWSDMLAVRPDLRGRGIGRELKLFQRDEVRAIGVGTMFWTFDPLVARNARLNLVTLGAGVSEYVRDMYGAATSSALHQGLGTDRFIAAWPLDDATASAPRTETPLADCAGVPELNTLSDNRMPVGAPAVRVSIPLHIDRIQQTSLADAGRWRAETRRAFLWAFAHGYHVSGYYRDEPAETAGYILAHEPAPSSTRTP